MINLDWIETIDGYNFLGIYDVILDIEREYNISPRRIIIPLLPSIIRFSQLFPADGTNHRDNYCDLRWKAVEFLKTKEVLRNFELLKGIHRWDGKLEIHLNENPITEALAGIKSMTFKEVVNIVSTEYKKRNKGSTQECHTDFWTIIHPEVTKVAKSRFESGHFADSVEAAFKEINSIIKDIVKNKTGNELDGADLMNTAFSPKNPLIVLDDLSTESGKNIQLGYMQIFAGSMTGIRNPKAHSNIQISDKEAIHFLHLASILMYKIK